MKKKTRIQITSLSLSLFLFSISTFGQIRTITGKVVNEEDIPMIGVNIIIEGTTFGTTTDIDGKYEIKATPESTIRFAFNGYKTEKVKVESQSIINITLYPDETETKDIVIVGYGSVRKKNVTSAITVVDEEALAKIPTANITSAIQGMTPGVEVQGNQGRPGEMPTIRIRGVSSTNSTDPLFVVDGIPMDNAYVNSSDIESVQVLKDAASCAIYGSRGANGVIIITTKNGKTGIPKISYNGYYGIEKAWKQLELLNIEQWADLVVENNLADMNNPPPLAIYIQENGWDSTETDWQNEIFQSGAIFENNFDISGGTDNINYFFSANQFQQDGIILNTPFTRYSVRMNSNLESGRFKFGENISYIYAKNRAEANILGRSVLEEAIKITTNIPVKNPDRQGGYSGYSQREVEHDAANPVGFLMRNKNINYNKRFIADIFGDYKLSESFNFRSTFGIVSHEYQNRNLELETNMTPVVISNTRLSETASWSYNWIWENMVTFHKIYYDHDITAVVAYTSEETKYHSMKADGTTLPSELTDILNMVQQGDNVSGTENESSRISILSRLMYTLKGKYIATLNFRKDGSSKFGDGNKWGGFPSASVAWHISDEPFIQNLGLINDLKLRSGYGVVGNDNPIPAYSYLSGLSVNQDYTFNNAKYPGVSLTEFNNPTLSWETVKQFDIGVDVGLFKGTIEITSDFFHKKTNDMIVRVRLPGSSGTSEYVYQNIGEILNRGYEFSAAMHKKIGDLNFSVKGNLTTIYNEILDIKGKTWHDGAVEFGNYVTRMEAGLPIGSFYGYKVLGIFPDEASVKAYTHNGNLIQPDAKPGDIKWGDLDNNGIIDGDDRYNMGSPIPKYTYGLTANILFKGFDLFMFFQGISGNKIYAELVAWTEGMHNNYNCGVATLDRWQKEGDITSIPRAVRNDPNGNITKASDRYIKDGSYLRLKNFSFGYTLPGVMNSVTGIKKIRLYFTGRNLLTFTDYPFYDPEIGSNALGTQGTANTSRGIDNGYYPQARTMIMGIQFDF